MSRDVATMDELAIEGCTLRVRVEGQDTRPALVLSHMLGTDLTLWDALVPELAKHFRVVRYDTRGHGGSGLGEGPVTLDRLGRDVVAILDGLAIERAHFCGLSMGGAVGLWLLAHAPARIERAVIAGSAPKLGEPAVWNGRIAAALADGMEQAVEPTIERWFSPAFVERAPEPVEAIRTLLRATSSEGYAACCGALRDMDLREAVRGVTNPVLVLRGSDDPAGTAADAEQLVEAMANATSVEVDAKHCAVIEDGPAFAAAVVKFLTAKTAPRRAPGRRAAAEASTPAKPSARRTGKRGVVAARRPVARTAPVSGKAVAKASATRKTAARAAPPAPSRRRAAAKPPRAAAPKTAPRKDTEVASSRPVKAEAPGRSKPASGKASTAATRTAAARARPTAAALRAAARTKAAAAPGKTASSKAPTASAKTKAAKPAVTPKTPAKTATTTTKGVGAKATAKAAPAKTPPAKRPPAKTSGRQARCGPPHDAGRQAGPFAGTRLRRQRAPQAVRRPAAFAVVLLGLAAWASAAGAQAVRIGIEAPLTGTDSVYGNAIRLGAEQAITDLGPGFAGRRAVPVPRDDGNDPKKGVEVARRLVADKVDLVVGPFSSAVAVPATAIYAEAGALVVTPTAAAPVVTDRGLATVFRTCGRADAEPAVVARFVAARRVARVALVHDRSAPGKEFVDGVRRRLGEIGIRDIYYGSFEKGARDVAALAGRIKAAKAELVVFGGAAADAGLLAKQLREAGARATLMGGTAMASDEFAAVAGPAADGALVVFPEDPRTRPAAADLLHRLQSRGIEPDFPVFYAYAAVQVMAQAATAAGSVEPGKIAAAMHEARTFSTVVGDLAFDAKGDPKVPDYTVYVWHRGASGRMAIDEQARS